MLYSFNEIKLTGKRKVIVNGKKKIQQKTFSQTVNPFNKNLDGSIKSAKEIIAELKEEIAEWQAQGN